MPDITVKDYEEFGPEFFDKYNYVKQQLGKDAKAEDVMAVMKALGAIVVKKKKESKDVKIGFN